MKTAFKSGVTGGLFVIASLPIGCLADTDVVAQSTTVLTKAQVFAASFIIMAALVISFLVYLRKLQKDFLETCTREKQLALFSQSPAGLPEGTIRGVIAMLIVSSALLLMALGEFPQVLGGLMGTVIGFYFGARGQGKDSDNVLIQQAQQVTAQRDEIISEQQQSKTGQLLDKLSSGIEVARTVATLLPKDTGQTYIDLANKVEKGVTLAKSLVGDGKVEDALKMATDVSDELGKDNPLQSIVTSSLKTFGAALGPTIPAAVLITALVAGTVKLTGIFYQKWKARVLHLPFSPATGLTLELVDDNTGFMLLQQSPQFRNAFKDQLQNPKFITDATRDFLTEASSDKLFEKYGALGKFDKIQQFEDALDEYHRTAVDREIKSLVLSRDPTMFGQTGGYESVMKSIDILHQHPDALKDLDSLVVVTEKLQSEDKAVSKMIQQILESKQS